MHTLHDRTGFAGIDEPVRAPGLAAMVRRHPQAVRNAAAAMIVSGIALFVAASAAVNAGADPGRATAAPAAATATATPDVTAGAAYAPPTEAPATGPVLKKVVAARPVHAKPAPANKAVISGLAANGIPNVALNAYRVAAARMANVDPGCGIDWALLAGIGREESDHGRFAGAVLHSSGVSTPRIIGIPLNGHGTALILDTDRGRVDGDTVYDRAVGPMQFIPSTWAAYGVDATGDGVADPFNINDAALTSARYLCAAGGNLHTQAGQVAAVLAYNYSDQYLAQVLALADAYRRGIPVSGVPVGNITGALPPVNSVAAVPPVNPGAPTANRPTTHRPPAHKSAKKTTAKPAKTTPATTTGSTGGGRTSGSPGGGAPSTSPTSGGSTGASSTPPISTPTSTPPATSPTPTPTKVCVLWDLLTPGKCDIYLP